MRSALLLLALVGAGCLHNPARVGQAPFDRDQDRVREAIRAAAQPSFDRNLRGEGWVARGHSWGSGGSGGQTHWDTVFACRKSEDGPSGDVWSLPTSEYSRVLPPVRADVLAAIEKTGAEVSWAPAVEGADGPNPESRFVIRYLRKNREVAGEVVGRLAPTDRGPDERYSELRITFQEWYCK